MNDRKLLMFNTPTKLYHLLVVCPWPSHLTSLYLDFLIGTIRKNNSTYHYGIMMTKQECL